MNNLGLNSISKRAVRIIVAAFTCALLFFSKAPKSRRNLF